MVRVDIANKEEVNLYREKLGIKLGRAVPKIYLIKEAKFISTLDSMSNIDPKTDLDVIIHHMQRLIYPVVSLENVNDITEFLDTTTKTIWKGDYQTGHGLFKQAKEWHPKNIDFAIRAYNTRAVVFISDPEEFADEIALFKQAGEHSSERQNLRLGIVTDTSVIKEVKQKHANYFFGVGMSTIVLVRYDGKVEKIDLAENLGFDLKVWLNHKSTKMVDEFNADAQHIMHLSGMNMFLIFVDYDDKKVASSCHAAVKVV